MSEHRCNIPGWSQTHGCRWRRHRQYPEAPRTPTKHEASMDLARLVIAAARDLERMQAKQRGEEVPDPPPYGNPLF